MPKMPNIEDVIATTLGRSRTRREVLKDSAGSVMPEAEMHEQINLASGFFKQNPDLWDPEWGPLEEAEPEDLVDAMGRVLSILRGPA